MHSIMSLMETPEVKEAFHDFEVALHEFAMLFADSLEKFIKDLEDVSGGDKE